MSPESMIDIVSFFGPDSIVFSVLSFILAVVIIVAAHEFGHYAAARACGIGVRTFSIGFGPVIAAWRDRSGTSWQISAIPLGGYVAFAESEADPSGQPIESASLLHRFLTVAAGPFASFVFSALVFAVLISESGSFDGEVRIASIKPTPYIDEGLMPGDTILSVDGWPVERLADLYVFSAQAEPSAHVTYMVLRGQSRVEIDGPFPLPPLIDSFMFNSAGKDAGLERGDVLTAVDGNEIWSVSELSQLVSSSGGAPLDLSIWRAGQERQLRVQPRVAEIPDGEGGFDEQYLIGIITGPFFEPEARPVGALVALVGGAERAYGVTAATVLGIVSLAKRQISPCNLQGPVGIARVTSQAAAQGASEFLFILGALSAVIGIMNLLPVPGLDGGHLAYFAVEAVTGRKPSEAARRRGLAIGIAIVFGLLGLGLFNDFACP